MEYKEIKDMTKLSTELRHEYAKHAFDAWNWFQSCKPNSPYFMKELRQHFYNMRDYIILLEHSLDAAQYRLKGEKNGTA